MDKLYLIIFGISFAGYIFFMLPFKQTLMDSKNTFLGRTIGLFLLFFYPITLIIIYIIHCLKRAKNK